MGYWSVDHERSESGITREDGSPGGHPFEEKRRIELSEEWKKHAFGTLDINCGFILDPVSRIARELLDSNTAFIAAIEAGEDSQGRHKIRLLTPAETVNRAFAMASAFYQIASGRMVAALPDDPAIVIEFKGQQTQIVEDAKYKLMRDQVKPKTQGYL